VGKLHNNPPPDPGGANDERREELMSESYTITRVGKEVVVRWPMTSSDAARVCGVSDDDWEAFHRFINEEWRPYLKRLRVAKEGDTQQARYRVEKEHAQRAAQRFGLTVPK
jgi:hypothetical protein